MAVSKHDLHELSNRQTIEALKLPVGEFAALIISALLTLAFFLGPPTLGTQVRNAVRVTASALSGAEARAAEHHAGEETLGLAEPTKPTRQRRSNTPRLKF